MKALDSEGFARFALEVGRHVQAGEVLTVSSKSCEPQRWDVHKTSGGGLTFSVAKGQSRTFPAWFLDTVARDGCMGVILRTFTNERDELTGHMIEELRGYVVSTDGEGRIAFDQMSARDLAEASTANAEAGKFLAPERSVVYCGPGRDYLDCSMNPVLR